MKSTTACDDQFIAGEDLAAGDLVIRTPEGVLVKGKLYVKPPAPPAPPPKTYGVFVGDPNVGTERASFQKLQDPAVVYMAMLRGEIAKLTWRQMVHLSGPVPNTADEALVEITRLRSEVKGLKADIDRYIEINAELATELTKLREQKPVVFLPENWRPTRGGGVVGSVFSDGHFKVPLYAAPTPAPAVPAADRAFESYCENRAVLNGAPGELKDTTPAVQLVDGSDDYYDYLGALVEQHPAGVMRRNTDDKAPAVPDDTAILDWLEMQRVDVASVVGHRPQYGFLSVGASGKSDLRSKVIALLQSEVRHD